MTEKEREKEKRKEEERNWMKIQRERRQKNGTRIFGMKIEMQIELKFLISFLPCLSFSREKPEEEKEKECERQ